MPDKIKKDEDKKNVRVVFPKDATAESIADGIKKIQNEWAKRYPERAHRLYPTVYDEAGNRVK